MNMKILNSLLGWIVVLAFGFLVFVYFFQQQQNEHQEKMVANTANLVQIKHTPKFSSFNEMNKKLLGKN